MAAETFRASWMTGRLTYTVAPVSAGTLFRQRETLTPKGPLRLLDSWIAGRLGPNLVARLEEIRDLLDAGAVVELPGP